MEQAGVGARASDMYASLGTGLVELSLTGLGNESLSRRVDLSRVLPRITELRARGRGVVIATAHTGNWDLLACAAAERLPLSVITKRLSIGFLDRVWQSLRARRGVRLLVAGSALRPALDVLARGEAVAMMVDQAPERLRSTITAVFLGSEARVDLVASARRNARAGSHRRGVRATVARWQSRGGARVRHRAGSPPIARCGGARDARSHALARSVRARGSRAVALDAPTLEGRRRVRCDCVRARPSRGAFRVDFPRLR